MIATRSIGTQEVLDVISADPPICFEELALSLSTSLNLPMEDTREELGKQSGPLSALIQEEMVESIPVGEGFIFYPTDMDIKELKVLLKQIESLGSLVRNITLLEGKKGRGKSLAAIALANKMRKFFGIPTVTIGSNMDLQDTFGPYVYLNEKDFINNLEGITKISKATEEGELGDAIETVMSHMGVSVTNALLIFDEAYKFFDCRTPSDKLVRVFGYFVAQSRHYKSSIMLLSPNRDMIDKRVRRQVDFFGRCFTNHKTHITTVRLRGGADSWRMRIYGPKYWDMYDTHALLGFRTKHLQFKE